MGRHGTGGSDDEDEWGNEDSDDIELDLRSTTDPAARWAAVPDPTMPTGQTGPDVA